MLQECYATHVLSVIWGVEFDVGTLFLFCRRKVKIISNKVKLQNYTFSCKNMPILSFFAHDSKSEPHIAFKKRRHDFCLFLPLYSHHAETDLTLCMFLVCIQIYSTYLLFMHSKLWIL